MQASARIKIKCTGDDGDVLVRVLRRLLKAEKRLTDVSEKFHALETNAQRVDFAYRLLDEHELFPPLLKDKKNNELAQETRSHGNGMFKAKDLAKAFEFYSKSIALAEIDSEQMGLAYANRSAVLFEQGFYEECLTDIDLALQAGYPEHLKAKVLARREKATCLKPKRSRTNYFEPIPEIPANQRNKSIQCAADSVEIRYTPEEGRHVVAVRDISPGEVIAIEEPFCHVLYEQFYSHCHACLKLCYNLIPCKNCTKVMFCSETCRDNAVAYHQYECPILATIDTLKIDRLKLLPLKIAVLVRDQYSDIEKITKTTEDSHRSDSYKEIHNLLAHTAERSVSDVFNKAALSALLFHCVKNATNFFNGQDEEEEIFKELVMLHMQVSTCNCIAVAELSRNDRASFSGDTIGGGLYAFHSLLNHKCSPNMMEVFYGPVMVTRAWESIKKGQQCYRSYGFHHTLEPRQQRRQKLLDRYYFKCACEVCKEDWPLYSNLPTIKTTTRISILDMMKVHQKGDISTAKKVIAKMLPKLKELERKRPNMVLAESQMCLYQCFALLGNVRRF